MKRGFLIDIDGVIYKNDQMIDGADAFIDRLLSLNMPFRFLTNNSQHARRDIATKLKCTGIEVDESHIFTCAMATARFLARQKANGTAYVIGEGGLLRAMDHNGYSIVDCKPDYVVVGEGHSLTLEVIEKATNLIDGGAKLIATNLYANCPTADGIRPGCGAYVSLLEAATGARAFSVGKPSPIIMRLAAEDMDVAAEDIIVIGDTMETDILGGVQVGARSVLVLTGATSREDLGRYAYQPDLVVESIADLNERTLLSHLSEKSAA